MKLSTQHDQSSAPRILLHSHDSYGLGHLRRTLTIAGSLAERIPGAQVLITSGSACATSFPLHEGVDIVKLPSVTKNGKGELHARSLRAGMTSLLSLRRAILSGIFKSFSPQIMIVDHQPLGLAGELKDVLRIARSSGTHTILGLRDIIDAPDAVAREWSSPAIREALSEFYDRVLIYGSPEVFDPRIEYPIPSELRDKVEFVGYVVRDGASRTSRALPSLRPQVLVTVGGGEDGDSRIRAYFDALELAPPSWDTTLLLGPLMDAECARSLKRRGRLADSVTVHTFHADLPRLIAESDAVVGMAGYNSVAEIMQARVPAVLLPRTAPRREQAIRAQRLAALGLAQCLETPEPHALRHALEAAIAERTSRGARPNLKGREGVVGVCQQMLGLVAQHEDQRVMGIGT